MTEAEATRPRHRPAGPHRCRGDCRRRSGDNGPRTYSRLEAGAGEGRLVGQGPRPRRGHEAFAAQARAVYKSMAWDPQSLTLMAAIAISHSIGASGARVFNTLSTKCAGAARKRAWRRSASAGAWASLCAWNEYRGAKQKRCTANFASVMCRLSSLSAAATCE